MSYPDDDHLTAVPDDVHPHDDECEVARRDRDELSWPVWRSCSCKYRRENRSKEIPERPVALPWLTGRAS